MAVKDSQINTNKSASNKICQEKQNSVAVLRNPSRALGRLKLPHQSRPLLYVCGCFLTCASSPDHTTTSVTSELNAAVPNKLATDLPVKTEGCFHTGLNFCFLTSLFVPIRCSCNSGNAQQQPRLVLPQNPPNLQGEGKDQALKGFSSRAAELNSLSDPRRGAAEASC